MSWPLAPTPLFTSMSASKLTFWQLEHQNMSSNTQMTWLLYTLNCNSTQLCNQNLSQDNLAIYNEDYLQLKLSLQNLWNLYIFKKLKRLKIFKKSKSTIVVLNSSRMLIKLIIWCYNKISRKYLNSLVWKFQIVFRLILCARLDYFQLQFCLKENILPYNWNKNSFNFFCSSVSSFLKLFSNNSNPVISYCVSHAHLRHTQWRLSYFQLQSWQTS